MRASPIVLIVAALVLASGCGSRDRPPPLPDAEWDAAHNRHYENLTQEEFYAAAEEVFRLADEGCELQRDLYGTSQLVVTCSFSSILFHTIGGAAGLLIKNYWLLRAISSDGGIDGNVRIFQFRQTFQDSVVENEFRLLRNIADLELFWERMDYALGRANQWSTCIEAAPNFFGQDNQFQYSAMCHPGMNDVDPRTEGASTDAQDPLDESSR